MRYLASPYTAEDPAVREQRFEAACQAAACLLRRGDIVFAPIVNSHPLVKYDLPNTWPFWERIDKAFLEKCDELVVLTLDGWKQSRGVRAEIAIARELGKPISYLAPEDAEVAPTLARDANGTKS